MRLPGKEPIGSGGPMPVQGVIFDLGHTLMSLDGSWAEMFAAGVADLAGFLDGLRAPFWPGAGLVSGRDFALALLEHRDEGFARARQTLREATSEESLRRTFAHFGLPDPSSALVLDACDAFFAHEEACWKADPHALPLLRALAGRGLRLGLYSNATDDRLIQRLVDRFGFRPYLDPALTSAGTRIRKPDPSAFQAILAAWRLPPGSVVMVGDSLEDDIQGAQAAGLSTIWIRARPDARQEGSYGSAGDPSHRITPDRTIASLSDLLP